MNDNYEEDYEVNNEKQEISQVREYSEKTSPDGWSTKPIIITKHINPTDFVIDKTDTSNEIEEIDSYSDTGSDYSDESNSVVSQHSEKSEIGGIINISEMLDSKSDNIDESETVQALLNGVDGEELDKGLDDTVTSDNKSLIIDESMSVNQLKEICKDKGLSVSGSKSKLISRIKENQ